MLYSVLAGQGSLVVLDPNASSVYILVVAFMLSQKFSATNTSHECKARKQVPV
jgi:hypothetical protein